MLELVTRSDWRAALLEASPDHGGSHEGMVALLAVYRDWRVKQRVCAYDGCRAGLADDAPARQRFCRMHCRVRALAAARRKPRRVTEGREAQGR